MSGPEIREKIIANNKLISERDDLATFVLNKIVLGAMTENEQLRKICPHEYDEMGFCIYCDSRKD